jgi:hypothetical protein
MIPFHIDGAEGPPAVAFEDEAPCWSADAVGVAVEDGCGQRLHAPAGAGRAGSDLIDLSEQKACDARTSAKREAPGCGQIKKARGPLDLDQDCRKTATVETFLRNPQRIQRSPHAHYDQSPQIEPKAIEADTIWKARLVGSGTFYDPKDRSGIDRRKAGKDRGGEPRGRAVVAAEARPDLVQRVAAEPSFEQSIEPRDGQRE